jgi:hypothetical protein
VVNPCKKLPVIYKALHENGLISDGGIDDFKKVFISGVGSITWLGKQQSQLGYFILQIKNKGIVTDNDIWESSKGLFIIKGKPVNNLKSLKAGGNGVT